MRPLYDCVIDDDWSDEADCHEDSKVQTNCPNCGAPINPNLEKCEYCGTYHLNQNYINYLKGKYIESSIKYEQARIGVQTSLDLFSKAMKSSMQSAKDDKYLDELEEKNNKKSKHKIKRLLKRLLKRLFRKEELWKDF